MNESGYLRVSGVQVGSVRQAEEIFLRKTCSVLSNVCSAEGPFVQSSRYSRTWWDSHLLDSTNNSVTR